MRIAFNDVEHSAQLQRDLQAQGYRIIEVADTIDGKWIEYEPAPPECVVQVSVSGGDGMDPPGVSVDDPKGLQIIFTATYRGQRVPLRGKWRIPVRDADGRIVDMVAVHVVDGEGSMTYRPSAPGIYTVNERDFEAVNVPGLGRVAVRLDNPLVIKAYREI